MSSCRARTTIIRVVAGLGRAFCGTAIRLAVYLAEREPTAQTRLQGESKSEEKTDHRTHCVKKLLLVGVARQPSIDLSRKRQPAPEYAGAFGTLRVAGVRVACKGACRLTSGAILHKGSRFGMLFPFSA
jgi:hypothetical protein